MTYTNKNNKKYNWGFSFFNLFAETQKEVAKLQFIVKGATATIVGTAWYSGNSDHALIVGITGFTLDVILGCFWFEEIK